jgi:hypothetical protein
MKFIDFSKINYKSFFIFELARVIIGPCQISRVKGVEKFTHLFTGNLSVLPLLFESRKVICLYCYKQKITGESGEEGGGRRQYLTSY